jgi:hypothetical protein
MTDRHTLIAFCAVLLSIVLLVAIGAVLVAMGRTVEALGVGAAVSGLIGVLGTFRPSKPTTAVNQAETVNTGTPREG